jgi:hypothetical protein
MSDSSRRRHRGMLLIACAVTGLSFVLAVRSDERVTLPLLPDRPLPPTCLSRSLFGVGCPGCGLTRSFVYLAHGAWQESLREHRLGWLLAFAVLMQFPYRGVALWRKNDRPLGRLLPRVFSGLLIFLLIGNWVVQVLVG